MSDPDRLEELRRQRAKLEAELARVQSEISTAPAQKPAAGKTAGKPIDPAAEELFRKFADDQKSAPVSKSGCWTAFIVVLLVGIAIVTLGLRLIYR